MLRVPSLLRDVVFFLDIAGTESVRHPVRGREIASFVKYGDDDGV